MKNKIVLFFKGFIMGIANIIPGVSGGTLAIILGIYEDFIGALSHLFSHLKKNLLFLIPLGLGMFAAIASMSNVIDYSYDHFPFATTLFFVGLVLGGIPLLRSKVDSKNDSHTLTNVIVFTLAFGLVIFVGLADFIFDAASSVSFTSLSAWGYILLFLVGILAAGTMVIPGVSGSLVLMLLGYYYPVVKTIKALVHFKSFGSNAVILGVFGLGILVGIVLISRLFEYLFNKHETVTYYGVLGFIYASILAIPMSLFASHPNLVFNLLETVCGLIVLGIGYLIAYKLGDK